MQTNIMRLALAVLNLHAVSTFATSAFGASPSVDFVSDIQPILSEHCYECHGGSNDEGGLNLAIKARGLAGGDSGAAFVSGKSDDSLLMQLVAGTDPDRVMPPEGERLSPEQVGLLKAWIDQGAIWPDGHDVMDPKLDRAKRHWAFQRFTTVDIPADGSEWSQTPIDRFVIKRLRDSNLDPTSAINARALIRRIYFDLIGLPPEPQQVDAFVSAAATDRDAAIKNLIDELLASRHYGERWARHWLDVARYTDSDGQEADRDRPNAYHYRDFVIRSFNEDLPYDQLVRWQIAGDEYEPTNPDAIVATGFLTAGPNTVLADTFLEEERLRNRYNELDDVVSTLGTSMLGLTVGCARCHDHKFDAISARDYYQLVGVFHSGDRHKGKLPNGKEGLFFKDFGSERKTSWLFERGDFYDRDEEVSLGFPEILTAEKDATRYWEVAKREPKIESTYQRRALADWITDVDHGAGALLARVIVNRIWQHHFGHGIVRTTSDFGVRGSAPSHPELLEWLAADFVANGWKIKRLHAMILQSAVYHQGTTADEAKKAIDPSNQMLWRMVPQRLEAEILRDAMLSVSGTLNEKAYGPGFKPPISAEAIVARNLKDGGYPKNLKDNDETRRRSIYMFHKRLVPYPLFQAFDRPDLLQTCARRENTTVAPQALALLNDQFVRSCGDDFSARLMNQHGDDNTKLVATAFQLALCREPSSSESAASIDFIQQQTTSRMARDDAKARANAVSDFCQSLFGLNEFIYVD